MLIDSEYNHSSTLVNNYSSLTAYDRGYSFLAMKYGERLRFARHVHAKLTQEQLAEKIGHVCTQENISKLERGDATGSEFTAQFAEACGVRAIWLAEEKGEMVAFEVAEPTASYAIALSPDDKQILDTAQYLPPDKLNALMDTVRKHADEKRALYAALIAQRHADENREPVPEPAPPAAPPRRTSGKPYKLPEPGIAKPHTGHHKKRSA